VSENKAVANEIADLLAADRLEAEAKKRGAAQNAPGRRFIDSDGGEKGEWPVTTAC